MALGGCLASLRSSRTKTPCILRGTVSRKRHANKEKARQVVVWHERGVNRDGEEKARQLAKKACQTLVSSANRPPARYFGRVAPSQPLQFWISGPDKHPSKSDVPVLEICEVSGLDNVRSELNNVCGFTTM
jgi:hypothetical protein